MSCYITYNNKNYTEKDFKEYLKSLLTEKQTESKPELILSGKEIQRKEDNSTYQEFATEEEAKAYFDREVLGIKPQQEVAPTPTPPKQATVITPEMIRARVKSSFDKNGYMDIKEENRGDKVILGAITKYIMATRGIVTNNQILEANKTFKLKEEVTIETIKEGVLRIKIKESLLEGDGDAGLFGGLDMSRLTSSGESMANDIFKVKEGVSEVFKDNESLASIGTEQQYSEYLDTIFPESKVKDVLYHGSKNTVKTGKNFENFDVKESWGKLLYFTKDISQAINYALYDKKGVYQVILNIKNPTIEIDNKIIEKPVNSDGYVTDYTREYVMSLDEHVSDFAIEEITVANSAQVHILGSKQDIEGFKDFVSKNKSLSNVEQAFKCK